MGIFVYLKMNILKIIFKLDNQTLIKSFLNLLCCYSTHRIYLIVNMLFSGKRKDLFMFLPFLLTVVGQFGVSERKSVPLQWLEQ